MAYVDLSKELNEVMSVHPNLLSEAKEYSKYMDSEVDKGIINEITGSSVIVNKNGDVSLSASLFSQQKYTADGHAIEQSIESDTISIRKRLEVDEVIINDHKLNPAFYEYTDMKQLFNDPTLAIGNLTVSTTVLVKAWEPTLKKWVLIRRPARMPMFSNVLNLSDAPKQMDIDSDISDEILKASNGGKKEW